MCRRVAFWLFTVLAIQCSLANAKTEQQLYDDLVKWVVDNGGYVSSSDLSDDAFVTNKSMPTRLTLHVFRST